MSVTILRRSRPEAILAAWLAIACAASAATLQPVDGGSEATGPTRWISGTPQPAEFLGAEPTYKSGAPVYVSFTLGDDLDSVICGALDGSGPEDYTTLYLDANNNGDLTDDPVVTLEKRAAGSITHRESGPVALTVRYFDGAERQLTARIHVSSHSRNGQTRWSFHHTTVQHLEGRVELPGHGPVLIAIYDAPGNDTAANGCFNDLGVDRFRVDLDGNGRLDTPAEESQLSRVFLYAGKLWELSIDSSGSEVGVSACKYAAGYLRLSSDFAAGTGTVQGVVHLAGSGGYQFTCGTAMAEPLRVPEGAYRVASDVITLKGADGKAWSARFAMPGKATVEAGAETALALGRPLTVTPKISGTLKPGHRISIRHTLTGRAGEAYSRMQPSGRRIPPRVTITSDDGTVVTEGNMEYG